MESIQNLLREYNEPVPVPLELPEDDLIIEIEEELLLSIPPEFRQYLLTCSDIIYGAFEPVTAEDSSAHTHISEVTAYAWSVGVPREYWVLCQLPKGFYLVDQDDLVHFWDYDQGLHEDESEIFDSVWHWVRDVWLASDPH